MSGQVVGGREPSDKKFISGMLVPAFIVFIIGTAIPLILAFYISLTNSSPAQFIEFPPTKWLDNFFSFLNPGERWTRQFYQYFYQTLFFVVASVSLELIFGIGFALIVNRSFKGRGLVRAALLVPWALPTVVSALVFRELFAPSEIFGLVNELLQILGMNPVLFYGDPAFNFGTFALPVPIGTFPFFEFKDFRLSFAMLTIIVVEIWKTTPFMALLVLAALQTVPQDLYKAADIEGASAIQKFRHITLPLIKGPVIIAVLFRIIDAIRVYDSVVVFRDDSIQSITVVAVNAWEAGSFGISSAMAIFELAMIGAFAIIIFKLDKNKLLFGLAAFLFLYERIIVLSFEILSLLINYNLVWLSILFLALLLIYRYRPQFFTRLETKFIVIFCLVVGVILILFLVESDLVSFSIMSVFSEFINSIIDSFIFIIIIGLLVLQLFLLTKYHPIVREKTKRSFYSYYLLVFVIMFYQFFSLVLEFIRISDIPLPGFILTLLPLQEAIQITYQMGIVSLSLGLFTSFSLFISLYLSGKKSGIKNSFKEANQDESRHDLRTYVGILLLLEFVSFFLINFGLFVLINFGLILIGLFSYMKKISIISLKSEKLDSNTKIVLFSFVIIIELFLLFLQDFFIFLIGNILLIMYGAYLYRKKKYISVSEVEEFRITVDPSILRAKRFINWIGFGAIVFLLLSFTLAPFLWMINRSFRNPCRVAGPEPNGDQFCFNQAPAQNEFELSPFLDPEIFSLQSYDIVLNSETANLIQALINGFILSGLTAIIVVFVGSFVAAILAKYHFPGERYIVLIIFSMSSLPPIIIIIPYLIQILVMEDFLFPILGEGIRDFTLVGSFVEDFFKLWEFIPILGPFLVSLVRSANGNLLTLVIPYTAFNLPLGVFLIRSFFREIPDELIKAAKVDGASNFQTFRKITARIFLIGNNDSYTVPLALQQFLVNPSQLTNIPWIPNLILATGAVIATVPLVLLVLLLQRYIISGITAGAVKG
ncbi:MAG: ABC transporter permease [Candidatus Hodarchaeales archaeon]|jgi:ABC-type sugar transport system permease subunit